MDWIAHVTEALFSTYRGASKLPNEFLAVEGYSFPLVRRLLNNLCDFDGCRYVEVGTWQGATALSASYVNRGFFKAIDIFSKFGEPREVCLRNRERWRAQCHLGLIDADVWSYDAGRLGPVNVSPGNCTMNGWWNGFPSSEIGFATDSSTVRARSSTPGILRNHQRRIPRA